MAKLDKRFIDSLEPPAKGNRIVYDDDVKGFGIRITAKGAKAFVLNYRAKGIERRYTIGSYPDWSASAARKEAGDLKRRIDLGDDPMAERHEERQAPTFADLAADYLKFHATKKRSGDVDKKCLERRLIPYFGRMKVRDITHRNIDEFHRSRRNTPIQANREVALLSKMFTLADKWEWRSGNPAKGVERYPENKRERYLSVDELSHLIASLNEDTAANSAATANLIRLLLLTGARCGEAMSATWDQFDLGLGVWTKPSAHTKQKKTHRAPLSAPALTLLVDLKAKAEAKAEKEGKQLYPYLFPGRGEAVHLTEPKKYWEAVRERTTVRLWAANPDTPPRNLSMNPRHRV